MDIQRAVIRSYDRETHTATIQMWSAHEVYLQDVPVNHALSWWLVVEGAECGVVFFDETDPQDACIAFIYGGTPASAPPSDATGGHKQRIASYQ